MSGSQYPGVPAAGDRHTTQSAAASSFQSVSEHSSDYEGELNVRSISGKAPRIWVSETVEVDEDYMLASDEEWVTDDEEGKGTSNGPENSLQQLVDDNQNVSKIKPLLDVAGLSTSQSAVNATEFAPDASKLLDETEKHRALEIFRYCDARGEGQIDENSLMIALSLLGIKESETHIHALYTRRREYSGVDLLNAEQFLILLGEVRATMVDDELVAAIESAYSDLYHGILASKGSIFVEQRDAMGRPFILAEDLRRVLISMGDKLSDEEADRLIKDCRPLTAHDANGMKQSRIFFEQYRAMVLPGPVV